MALTADPRLRPDRAVAAARAHLQAGNFDAALGLLAVADADAGDDLQRARAELLRGKVTRTASSGREAPVRLLQAARRLEPLDVRLARDTYLDAWGAALVAGSLAPAEGQLLEVCRAARSAPRAPESPQPGDLLLDGLATLITEGPAAAAPSLRQAVDAFLGGQTTADQWLEWGVLAANAALALWDLDSWEAVSHRQVELARSSGALAALANALNVHRVAALWQGDAEAASALSVEEAAVKEMTGTRRASYGDLLLAAYQGRAAEASSLFAATAGEALVRGEGLGVQIADRATAIFHSGLGHYPEALAAAERSVVGNFGPFTAQALPELVEAAARSGQSDRADEALRRLTAYTAVEDADWAAGLEARSRALLSEGEEAERCYAEAVERLSRTRLHLELARARLLYGEWLRRARRRVDARVQLRAAYDAFVRMGAERFAERARRELLATGEKVRKRQADSLDELTPQEERVARLAREGRTNAEIGADLFISARTVEWHLRNVFDKLGIASRRDLQEALPG